MTRTFTGTGTIFYGPGAHEGKCSNVYLLFAAQQLDWSQYKKATESGEFGLTSKVICCNMAGMKDPTGEKHSQCNLCGERDHETAEGGVCVQCHECITVLVEQQQEAEPGGEIQVLFHPRPARDLH